MVHNGHNTWILTANTQGFWMIIDQENDNEEKERMKTLLTFSQFFRDLDHLELDDLTIPDVIKLPNNNNNNSSSNNKNLKKSNGNNGCVSTDQNTTSSSKSSIISNVKVDFCIFKSNIWSSCLIKLLRCGGSAT